MAGASPSFEHAVVALVEALEPRLLYSADVAPLVLPTVDHVDAAWMATPLTVEASDQVVGAQRSTVAAEASRSKAELVVIDSSVPELDLLLQDLRQQAAQGRAIDIVVVRAGDDGLDAITQALATRDDISAVHLIGHGQAGQMQLGDTLLDHTTLMTRAADIAQWQSALATSADILLYGCELGSTDQGKALITGLAALTGADVAANEGPTGALSAGGDWTLEVRQGRVDTAVAVSADAQLQWTGVLATATPSAKGGAIYNDAGSPKPQASSWDGMTLGNSGSTAVTANWTVVSSAQSATRDEAIVLGVGADGALRGQMWNGSSWVALPQNPLSLSATPGAESFAVAYEQQSGDAVLMWSNAGRVHYATWNGSTWSAEASFDVGGGTIERLQLAHKPRSDQMVLAVSDAAGDKFAMIWDGSQLGQRIVLHPLGGAHDDPLALAVAYESQSGTAMVAYGKHNDTHLHYRLFDGFTWSAEQSANAFDSAGRTWSYRLSADPNSDRLVLVQTKLIDSGGTTLTRGVFGIWDGNSWGARAETGDNPLPAGSGISIDATFESRSGEVLAVFRASDNSVRFQTWSSGGGWTSASAGPALGDTPTALRLFADPTSNHVMLGATTANKAASFTDWDGAAWGTRRQVVPDTGTTSTPAFTWVWRQSVSQPATTPTLWLGPSRTDADGWNGVNAVNNNQVLALSDPNLSFGNGSTGGTFSHVLDTTAWGANGLDDMAWVSRTVAINGNYTAQRGDVLFTTSNTSTLSSLNTVTVNNNDVVAFRPLVAGDYSRGTFTVLFTNVGGGDNVRGLALVEKNTVVGDVTLTAGSLLYTVGNGNGNARDIHWFVPLYTVPIVGSILTNVSFTLVYGRELDITKAINGLELIGTSTTIKNASLRAGQLLITLDDASNVATTGVAAGDVVALTLKQTSMTLGAQGTSTLLLRGSSLGFSGQPIDTLALFTPVGTHAPVITGDTAFTVPELTTTNVTTVSASDLDGNALTYSLSGGADQSRFTIDPDTGVLRFLSPPDAHTPGDADQDNLYQVTVRASDGALFHDRDLTVRVQLINRAPVNTGSSAVTAVEDTALAMTGLQVSDADAGALPLKVTLSVLHGTLTILDSVNGGLTSSDIAYSADRRSVVLTGSQAAINATLQNSNGATYQADAHYQGNDTLTFSTDDQGHSGLPGNTPSLVTTSTVDITVTSVPDAPIITSNGGSGTAAITVLELTTQPLTTVTAIDADSASLTYSIVGGTDSARFTIDAATGVLRFAAPPDSADGLTYQVVVRASDGALHDDQTLTVTVEPLNNPPVSTVPGAKTLNEDAAWAITGLAAQDPDAGLMPIRVSLSVNHGTLAVLDGAPGGLTSGSIVYGTDRRSVVLTGSQAEINATLQASNGLVYQADLDYSGGDTLTMVTDDQGHSGHTTTGTSLQDTQAVAITILPVTDTPVLNLGSVSATEDQDIALDLVAVISDTDNSGGQNERITAVTLTGFPPGATFSNSAGDALQVTAGELTLAPGQWAGLTMRVPANTTGTLSLTVTATAQDGSAAPAQAQAEWTIGVTAVNDAPVITSQGGGASASITVPEFHTSPVTTVAATDVEGATITYSIAGGADQALFTIDAATGVLRFVSPPDTSLAETYTVVVRASDGTLHDEQTLTVFVQHINQAPVNAVPGALTTDEDTVLAVVGLSVADTDAGALPISVHLQVQHGTLTIAPGISGGLDTAHITYGAGQRSVTLTGSQAAINATLQAQGGVRYLADLDYSGADLLTMTSNDHGHAGLPTQGTDLSDQDMVAITVRPVTDAPALQAHELAVLKNDPIALLLDNLVTDTDNSGGQQEHITRITIAGIPAGASFTNARGDPLQVQGGVLTLAAGQWLGLTMKTPPELTGQWTLTIEATAQDGDAQAVTTRADWQVSILPEALSVTSPTNPAPDPMSPAEPATAPSTPSNGAEGGGTPTMAPAPPSAGPATDGASGGALTDAFAALPEVDDFGRNYLRVSTSAGPQFVLELASRETPGHAAGAALDLDVNYSWLGSLQAGDDYTEELRRSLETLQQQLKQQGLERREVIASSIALTTGLSVGYVIWLVRGGALLGSMLSAMPAWAMVDPLPVLARARSGQGGDQHDDDDDSRVEDLFDGQDGGATPSSPEPELADGAEPTVVPTPKEPNTLSWSLPPC